MDDFDAMLLRLVRQSGSERKAAARFGLSQTSLNNWVRKRALPDDDQALKLAQMLNLDPAFVLAVIYKERAHVRGFERGVTDAWGRMVRSFGKAAALGAAAVGVSLALPSPTQAQQRGAPDAPVYYVKYVVNVNPVNVNP